MKKEKVLFGGITTEFDVKKLMESISPEAGEIIDHASIAAVIGQEWKSVRYKSVVAAWKRELEKTRNIHLEAVSGVGYRVLTEAEKMKVAAARVTRGTRSIGKGARLLASVRAETLSETERRTYDHQSRLTTALLAESIKTRKTIAVRLGEIQPGEGRRLRAVE